MYRKIGSIVAGLVCVVAATVIIIENGLPARSLYTAIKTTDDVLIAPEVNAFAPDFTLPSPTDETITLHDYQDAPVIVNFWATWCEPCLLEMQDLQQLHRTYAPVGLQIIGVNMGESPEIVTQWLKAQNITYPIALDQTGETVATYALRGQPSTFIIDDSGLIVDIIYGPASYDALENRISSMLNEDNV